MLAICGNAALRELYSPGKSGSSFYLTQDDRFMIKTVKKSEVKNWFQDFMKQIERDCEFLEAERIMDYSLLVGNKDSFQNEKFMRGCCFLEAELQDMDRVLASRYVCHPSLIF
ncbi:1-phosphatidylinositol-4-phosphate 5-kinase [Sarracenia purpurea var. burkii]